MDPATGLKTSWDPAADSTGGQIAISGSTIYVGVAFANIGGAARSKLAALDDTTALANSWNPAPNNSLGSLVVDGSTIYVGGRFTSIGGQTRNKLAAIDASTGLATAWNPNIGASIIVSTNLTSVSSILVNGSTIYAGGNFGSVGGTVKQRLAAIDSSTGIVTSWTAPIGGSSTVSGSAVFAMAVNGTTLFAGGGFQSYGGVYRNSLGAINLTTGEATSWNPDVNAQVTSILADTSSIFIGGQFASVGGQARGKLAEVDLSTGTPTAWNPNITAGSDVYAIKRIGSAIYAGGNFTAIGGQTRASLAKIDAATGTVDAAFNANIATAGCSPLQVRALDSINGKLQVGGLLTSIGGQARQGFGEIDPVTGTATSVDLSLASTWACSLIYNIVHDGSTMYMAGDFTSAQSQSRPWYLAYDMTNNALLPWSLTTNQTSVTNFPMVVAGDYVYLSGPFTTLNGTARNGFGAAHKTSAALSSWNPGKSDYVNAFSVLGSNIYAVGSFKLVGAEVRKGIAVFDSLTGLTP